MCGDCWKSSKLYVTIYSGLVSVIDRTILLSSNRLRTLIREGAPHLGINTQKIVKLTSAKIATKFMHHLNSRTSTQCMIHFWTIRNVLEKNSLGPLKFFITVSPFSDVYFVA